MTSKHILVAGGSGFIGTALCRALEGEGHTVLRLVRRAPSSAQEFNWVPSARIIDFTLLDRVDAVINLSGASLSHLPWSTKYRKAILQSRIDATHTLTDAMHKASHPPEVFLSGSAVGYYGDQPGVRLTEDADLGVGFLPRVVDAWEAAASITPSDTRTVVLRTGLVIGHGGAVRSMLPLARLGLNGPLGTGGQNWPWVSLRDEVRAISHLMTSSLSGPVNIAGPTPATADTVLRALSHGLHRPYGIPVPERLITTALRDAGRELLLASQKVVPKRLLEDGFNFEHERVDQAIAWLLAR